MGAVKMSARAPARGPDDFKAENMKPKFFRSPVHCAKLANDGLLYVCDRGNNRVQIFKASEVGKSCSNPDGEIGKYGFIGEVHVASDLRRHIGCGKLLDRPEADAHVRRRICN